MHYFPLLQRRFFPMHYCLCVLLTIFFEKQVSTYYSLSTKIQNQCPTKFIQFLRTWFFWPVTYTDLCHAGGHVAKI